MDIQITYETLFDLLRKERSLDELQPLAKDFWNQVMHYILEREGHVTQASSFEQEKARIQLANIKRIIKEIYERREQKIVRLALNVTRTKTGQYIDKRNMLATEQAFFDEQVELLKKYNQGVLLQLFNGQLPIIAPTVLGEDDEDTPSEDRTSESRSFEATTRAEPKTQSTEVITPNPGITVEAEPEQSSSDSSQPAPKTTSPEHNSQTTDPSPQSPVEKAPEAKVGNIIVRFTTNVPKFVGKNKEIFGPFEQGKIAQLPANIAQILLKKNKVEHVMAQH